MGDLPEQAVRLPKQKRSRESYERVLDAAHGLLEQNGFEGFTVQEVAARANVSVGAIYERFGNKETLLRTVHARLMDTIADFPADGQIRWEITLHKQVSVDRYTRWRAILGP